MNDHDKAIIKQFVEACKDLDKIDCNYSTIDLAGEILELETDSDAFAVAISVIEDYQLLARAIGDYLLPGDKAKP